LGKAETVKRLTKYGLEAATDHTFSYLGRYLLLGFIPIGVLACLEPGIAAALGIVHPFSVALLFPGALLINRIAMRVARTRTWHLQPWRAWVAAVLAVALEWGAVLALLVLFDDRVLDVPWIPFFGPAASVVIHLSGVLVLASTAAQITAWLLPPSSRR
jgi:hypothetical protein